MTLRIYGSVFFLSMILLFSACKSSGDGSKTVETQTKSCDDEHEDTADSAYVSDTVPASTDAEAGFNEYIKTDTDTGFGEIHTFFSQ